MPNFMSLDGVAVVFLALLLIPAALLLSQLVLASSEDEQPELPGPRW